MTDHRSLVLPDTEHPLRPETPKIVDQSRSHVMTSEEGLTWYRPMLKSKGVTSRRAATRRAALL